AITLAEASADGKGLEARLGTRNGQLIFELDVVTKGGFISEFEVDAMSGKVTWMARGSVE
ncbi:MAG: PepSY domain-containing protein, partial [Hyphomicrobiales bacterium]